MVFALVLRNLLPPRGKRPEGAPDRVVPERLEQSLHALRLDGLEGDPVYPRCPIVPFAISYAARKVSILQTWTIVPRRQDGPVFALT